MSGLNIGRLVNVTVNLSPLAAGRRGFGTLLIAGDSAVIDGSERLRAYSDIDAVAADFGVEAPEYQAATLYYGQSPRPLNLMVGRWLRTASAAVMRGGTLTATEQAMGNWTGIATGAFTVSIDGVAQTVSGLNFSGETNLNGVASVINAVLTDATIAWDGSRFTLMADSTGAASELSYLTAPGAGTDISALLKMTVATGLAPVPGFDAETAAAAVAELADASPLWYGLTFAAATMPDAAALVDVAAFVEATSVARIFGITETDTRVLDATYTADLASTMSAAGYKRTCVQYSANPHAVASLMGRAFSVNFAANRSTITLMYKQEPGVVAENITETQAQALKAKRCNIFVRYNNDTAILQYGVMSGSAYFDEIHGLDWFADALQNSLYNLLYTSATKVPQTDAGQNQLVAVANAACEDAVNNGLVAPGTWNADGFGQLKRGDVLGSGYYIYTLPINLQDQATREQRIAPPLQVALKLSGAVHQVDAIVNVNR